MNVNSDKDCMLATEGRIVMPDYEEMYNKAIIERDKAMGENRYLRDEIKRKERDAEWHNGFFAAVNLIFGGANNAG